jgi:citronellyl-CoA dehydrogenase
MPASITGAAWASPGTTRCRAYRDGRLGSIGGGSDEVMLGIICKYMGILPGRK